MNNVNKNKNYNFSFIWNNIRHESMIVKIHIRIYNISNGVSESLNNNNVHESLIVKKYKKRCGIFVTLKREEIPRGRLNVIGGLKQNINQRPKI